MTTPDLTDEQWFELVLGVVANHRQQDANRINPLPPHLTPEGCSTLSPVQKDLDGGMLDINPLTTAR